MVLINRVRKGVDAVYLELPWGGWQWGWACWSEETHRTFCCWCPFAVFGYVRNRRQNLGEMFQAMLGGFGNPLGSIFG